MGPGVRGRADLAFLVLVGAAASREAVAGKNWRNLRVVALVAVLAAGHLVFDLDAHVTGTAGRGTRIGIARIVMLVTLTGS